GSSRRKTIYVEEYYQTPFRSERHPPAFILESERSIRCTITANANVHLPIGRSRGLTVTYKINIEAPWGTMYPSDPAHHCYNRRNFRFILLGQPHLTARLEPRHSPYKHYAQIPEKKFFINYFEGRLDLDLPMSELLRSGGRVARPDHVGGGGRALSWTRSRSVSPAPCSTGPISGWPSWAPTRRSSSPPCLSSATCPGAGTGAGPPPRTDVTRAVRRVGDGSGSADRVRIPVRPQRCPIHGPRGKIFRRNRRACLYEPPGVRDLHTPTHRHLQVTTSTKECQGWRVHYLPCQSGLLRGKVLLHDGVEGQGGVERDGGDALQHQDVRGAVLTRDVTHRLPRGVGRGQGKGRWWPTLTFPVDGLSRNNFTVTLNDKKDKNRPNDRGDHRGTAGHLRRTLSALDHLLHKMDPGADLSPTEVLEQMNSFDSQGNGTLSFSWTSRDRGPNPFVHYPSPSYGRDAHQIFQYAGLVVFTDANVPQLPIECAGDMVPCMDGLCYQGAEAMRRNCRLQRRIRRKRMPCEQRARHC
ncbi:CD109 antigen, partial [Caerostris extrusa]